MYCVQIICDIVCYTGTLALLFTVPSYIRLPEFFENVVQGRLGDIYNLVAVLGCFGGNYGIVEVLTVLMISTTSSHLLFPTVEKLRILLCPINEKKHKDQPRIKIVLYLRRDVHTPISSCTVWESPLYCY